MQHKDQHVAAVAPTVKVTRRVQAETFDDKVKPMGSVTVEDGKITVFVGDMPTMISMEARRDFVFDSIRVALEHCWEADSEAFVRESRRY